MEINVIINVTSNSGKTGQYVSQIKKYFKEKNIKFSLFVTKHIGHATELAKKITASNNKKILITVGGDGTIHEVLNGIVNFENTYFAAIPAGSGNDFLNNFNTNKYKNIRERLDGILKNNYEYVDFLLVNNKLRGIESVGFGIVSNILKTYYKLKRFSPKTRYRLATLRHTIFYTPNKFNYSIDGKKNWIQAKCIIFEIGNGKTIGGGINVIPHGDIKDNLISVSYIEPINHFLIPFAFRNLLKKDASVLKKNHRFFTKSISIRLNKPIYHIDGQLYTDTSTLDIKIVHNKLKFIY